MVICTAQKHLQCSGDHVINISYSGYFTHTSEGGGASGLFMYVPVSKCLADISAPVLKCPDGTSSDMSRSIKSLTNVSKGHSQTERNACINYRIDMCCTLNFCIHRAILQKNEINGIMS